jgi:hypothetical protein
MKNWDEDLIGCFGGFPGILATFGSHPRDAGRAREWVESLRSRGLGWPEAEAQIRALLESENQSAEKVEYQLDRARAFFNNG